MIKSSHAVNHRILTQSVKDGNSSLSDYMPNAEVFPSIDSVMESFRSKEFLDLSLRKRFKQINYTLYQLIREAPAASFLLSATIDYLHRVNEEKVFNETLSMTTFEFWLNIFSDLSDEENYAIRSKIVGVHIPRSDYQAFFPIGMNRTFKGTHFVTAHLSPDVDTMIASFWGWMDAFACRIGTGLHMWCLPGGEPESPVSALMLEMFGKNFFSVLPRTTLAMTLTAMDLVGQQGLIKELGNKLISDIEYELDEKAIILVNEQGFYLGDWRLSDVELVRPVIIVFKSCLRWFENNLHTKLISLLAQEKLSVTEFPAFNSSVFDVKIQDCEPAREFTEKQKVNLSDFLEKILGMKNGLKSTFRELNQALANLSIPDLLLFQEEVEALPQSDIFDRSGYLVEDRPKIFYCLDKIIKDLDQAIHLVRNYVERLDVVLGIKHQVLEHPFLYLTLRSDVEEMRQKMHHYDFLTVVIPNEEYQLFPVGIVRASDLRSAALGTVSFRDFCNQEEVKMASYLEVISVADHHKTALKTKAVPTALIADVQSCNVLIAEQAFAMNDRYSLGGMSLESIKEQIAEITHSPVSPAQIRVLQRLLTRLKAGLTAGSFYVHPQREFCEYLSCLHAIFDDTDLLTKVSNRDVECVAQILNRLKSLAVGKEVEIIHFDDIPQDKQFAKRAAERILKHPDAYSLYKKVYDYREVEVESNVQLCVNHNPSTLFSDTKEQNNCARIGQTKMFASNFPYFKKNSTNIRQFWLNQAQAAHREQLDIDLHIHMVSTIASAEEVYGGHIGPYIHQDELWFWIPPLQQAEEHLASFLAGFQHVVKGIKDEQMHLEFLGPNAEEYKKIFHQYFLSIPTQIVKEHASGLPLAVLYFKAGTLNSRKSMISPFLPRLVP